MSKYGVNDKGEVVCGCGCGEFYWELSINEDGWRCVNCRKKAPGDPPGFNPWLDRREIYTKTESLLQNLHHHGFLYVGSGTEGDGLVTSAVRRCQADGKYDQYSLIWELFELRTQSHQDYWSRVSEAILEDRDERNRCQCGELATTTSVRDGVTNHYCNKHANQLWTAQN